MNILNLEDAGEKIQDLFTKSVEYHSKYIFSGQTCNTDLQNFTLAINDTVIAVQDAGFDMLLVDDSAFKDTGFDQMFELALSRTPLASQITNSLLDKLVTAVNRNGKTIKAVLMSMWSQDFYERGNNDLVHKSYQEAEQGEANTFAMNMRLAFSLFRSGDQDESLSVLKANTAFIERIDADCVVMPHQPGYSYNDDDPLVKFCRFVDTATKNHRNKIGYTVCHGHPIKREQNTRFTTVCHSSINMPICEHMSKNNPDAFAPGELDRYESIESSIKYLFDTFTNEGRISTQTLEEDIKGLSIKWATEDKLSKKLSFERIKVDQKHAELVEAFNTALKEQYPDYEAIEFVVYIPQEKP